MEMAVQLNAAANLLPGRKTTEAMKQEAGCMDWLQELNPDNLARGQFTTPNIFS
jgi:hypothetical protein